MWCEMTHCCLPTILRGLLCCNFPGLLHRMWIPQIGCQRYLFYIYSSTNNQPPCGPFYHSCYITCWNRILHRSCFCFFYFFPPRNIMLYLTHLLHVNLKNLPLCCFFPEEFSERNFYSVSSFYFFLFPPNSVFQNQYIYFLRYVYAIF